MEQQIQEQILSNFGIHCIVEVVLCFFVLAAVIVDMWDAVQTCIDLGERVHSDKLRKSVKKFLEYWRFMFAAFLIDTVALVLPFFNLPYFSMLVCVGLICIEVKSLKEHAVRRKSKAAELPEILKMIVDCATEADAKKALKKATEYYEGKKL